MTSNIGSQWIMDLARKDYEEMRRRVMDAVRAHFKPEFLNRIDELVIFHSLGLEQIKAIVEIQVKNSRSAFWKVRIQLKMTEKSEGMVSQGRI